MPKIPFASYTFMRPIPELVGAAHTGPDFVIFVPFVLNPLFSYAQ